jgi:hypothetical protein
MPAYVLADRLYDTTAVAAAAATYSSAITLLDARAAIVDRCMHVDARSAVETRTLRSDACCGLLQSGRSAASHYTA